MTTVAAMVRWGRGWAAWACLFMMVAACSRGSVAEVPVDKSQEAATQPDRTAGDAPRPEPTTHVAEEGLLIGEYRLVSNPIIDGDTIRVQGIERSIRLLSIDTEERIHGRGERAAIERDFEGYLERKRARTSRPPKAGTPMGEAAAEFAEAFFQEAEVVRLERDDPKEIRGRFGRPLAYAFVEKDGRWTSYSVECVRAGMSPYFTKYGYSHRFHNSLSRAEAEARDAKRGIWDPASESYRDYEQRKAWWNARAEFIRAFEHEATRRDDYVQLSHFDAEERLEERLGRGVTVLSTVEEIEHFDRLVRASLAMKRERHFPVVFFDKKAFRDSGLARFEREPVIVRGRVERYEKGTYRTLQIVVTDPRQVTLPDLPAPN